MWPPEELHDIPGVNREMAYFVERHSAAIRHQPTGSVIYRVEPWQGLVLAGRFEKSVDGTIPPREVEHAHAVLIDPKPTNNKFLLPSNLRTLLIGARQYRQFHSLSSEFYREVSIKLKINSQIPTNHPPNELRNSHLKVTKDIVERLETIADSNDENGIAEILTNLPDPLQFYVTWGFVTQPINSNRTNGGIKPLTTIDTRTASSEPDGLPTASVTTQIFDIATPNVTIENAYEFADSVLDSYSKKVEPAQATAEGLLLLVKRGISSDRIARALCSNSPRMYRKWTDSWHGIVERCLTSLYPDGWQNHIDRLGYPYLRDLINNSGQNDSVFNHSILQGKLLDSVANDERYRSFVDELEIPDGENILDIIEKLGDISDAHIDRIIAKHDSPNMARFLHHAIATNENYTTTNWATILRISSTVSKSKHPNHLKWWQTSLGEATDTSRSLLKKLSKREAKLEQFALEYYDHSTVEYIEQVVKLSAADDDVRTTANLNTLLNILQRKD